MFVDLENFTLNTGSENFKGGGVVGLFNNGVLRLSGTTTMTNAKPASAANCGQLVGNNNNVLTYAASSWTFNRSNGAKTDDLGTWGEVVRGIDDSSASNTIYFNSTDHTATIAAAKTSMGSADDFTRTALNIQLNQGSDYDCLKFTSGNNTRSYLLGTDLTIGANISLSGTGITGFMRDGGDVSTIGSFTGTLDGTNGTGTYTITLATGEAYGSYASGQTEGIGLIYRHQHNGLFAVLAGTVENLTIDGTIIVRNHLDIANINGAGAMNIGGIASRNSGNVTLTSVKINVTVKYHECVDIGTQKIDNTDYPPEKNIGGFLGCVGTNGTITINGKSEIKKSSTETVAQFILSGYHKGWNCYGGAIGKITASEFSVIIGESGDDDNKLTDSLTVDITGITDVGGNSDSGGLIGYITNVGDGYSSRIVTLNNVKFDSCTIGNAAGTNGGGFLGYAWLNTSTNINGVTVSGTINNSTAPNVGVMLYNSTGKMKVNSLAINGLTMTSGGGTSLGMIVNKAYDGDNGLYLDVLNAGYSLTCSAPTSGIFDEIAAYSASSVINGGKGTGVISINMNADRETANASFKTTGTYQNRLKTGNACANSRSRYYYNVDKMNINTNDGQNLVLWSLAKYAAQNIRGEFDSSFDKALSGTADLTGLSFYPLASANDNYSIGNLTLTFDYSGIYGTAETVSNTDSYNRDPAVSNQHYLMHSGLFIDQPSGKSLTVTGKLSLVGTFMEDGTHKGVLISGTENGNFTVNDSGLIELDGIKPMNGYSAYKSGYLLINNIARENDLVSPPSVTIKNLSNTDKYSSTAGGSYAASGTTDTVAKSLVGAVSGKGLNIVFSHIKLDARDGNSTDTNLTAKASDLYTAYKTYNSIFTDSTLLASIHTDQSAKLEYNYTKAEDWGTGNPRFVTYGKEVKDSLEYKDEEQRYYPDANGLNNDYTNPIDNTALSEVYNFSSGFLPYVKTAYNNVKDTDGCFYRELKVNVQSVSLSNGCGTYNDPYIIETTTEVDGGKVLTAIANFINSGDSKDLKEVVLPYNSANFDTLTENTNGARWHNGEDYHSTFTANGNIYTSEDGNSEWTSDNVRLYLANAYYKIESDITLGSNYLGLGCTAAGATGNYAFRGVIVGDKNVDGTPKYTVTNKSSAPFINVSNGSVVKDITVTVNADVNLNQVYVNSKNAAFNYHSNCAYYGGIIGEIMGGDNIIDNSYVTFASGKKVTLSGAYGMLCPVGSYAGVVVYGGLIFKNINTTNASTNVNGFHVYCDGDKSGEVNLTGENINSAIYVNPYVGRVINGYAINETSQFSNSEDGYYHDGDPAKEGESSDDDTVRSGVTKHSLKNGVKHYSIADVNKNEANKLSVANSTISIPNSQAFFVLSLITQSLAGTSSSSNGDYSSSLSYGTYSTKEYGETANTDHVYGMSHNADYTNIGKSGIENTDDDYVLASKDTAAKTAVPYIIDRYCANANARCVTNSTYYDIALTENVSYVLPDSFRGIGAVGNQNNDYAMKLDVFDGKGCTIDQDIYLNRYGNTSDLDNFFDKYHNNTSQPYGEGSAYNANTTSANHGIGLFDSVLMKGESSKISNFTLKGSLNTENYDLINEQVKVAEKNNEVMTNNLTDITKTGLTNGINPETGEAVHMAFDKDVDLDGKILLISNNRPTTSTIASDNNVDWYLNPSVATKHKTKNIDDATPFLFIKVKNGANAGKYIIAAKNNNKIQYLDIDCTLKDTISYFDLKKSNNRYQLWNGKLHLDHNNGNNFGNWDRQGAGSYMDFTECTGSYTGYISVDIVTTYETDSHLASGEEKIRVNDKKIHWLSTGGAVGWSTSGYW